MEYTMEKKLSDFCTCKDYACPLHPANHNKGCSLCIAKNIEKKEIPSCFFNAVNEYPSKDGYSFETFAQIILNNKNKQ